MLFVPNIQVLALAREASQLATCCLDPQQHLSFTTAVEQLVTKHLSAIPQIFVNYGAMTTETVSSHLSLLPCADSVCMAETYEKRL